MAYLKISQCNNPSHKFESLILIHNKVGNVALTCDRIIVTRYPNL